MHKLKSVHGFEVVEAKEILINLEDLKSKVLYSDSFFEITKDEQKKIYEFCLFHCTHKACKDNLIQIRYAVAQQYFGM